TLPPVIAGQRKRCLGVLTVETTEPGRYEPEHEAALTLLAAQAFWTLDRTFSRESAHLKISVLSDQLLELRSETSEEDLLAALGKRLTNLGYARGLFARVEYDA